MKLRDIPVASSLIVLAAVGTMIWLGFWQLDRLKQKEALLAHYAAAQKDDTLAAFPQGEDAITDLLYRRSAFDCRKVDGIRSVAGESSNGTSGWAHIATCTLPDGGSGQVALGWSQDPQAPAYVGGRVSGIIAPGGRIVADPPLAGLAALARPDPANIPNNHLAYAWQWFIFAATALVIYTLALRRRLLAK